MPRLRPTSRGGILALLLISSAPLAACGGGGGSSVAAEPPLAYGSMAPKSSWTEAELEHFLVVAEWAYTDSSWSRLQSMGLPAYVDAMLQLPAPGSTAWEQDAGQLLVHAEDPPGEEGQFPSTQDLSQWALYLMAHDENPFQEVLAFFWHDHFATSSDVLEGGNLWWMKTHLDLLRAEGAGNLKQLVLDVSRDWAMLRWLDGISSTSRAPNENYGREFLELFCLGVDNGYTQDDIVQAARAFTGYKQVTLDPDTGLSGVVFDPNRHDPGDKTVFGVTIPGQNLTDDYQAMVDLTFAQRPAAEWFARSLLSWFCYENPPDDVVSQLAQILRTNGYELAPALRAMFLSEAFSSPRARQGRVKSPVEFVMGWNRATNLPLVDHTTGAWQASAFRSELEGMAQVPTQPPNVNGWPNGALWLSAQGMVNRANFVRDVIVDRQDQAAAGYDVATLLPPGTPTAGEVVDRLARVLQVTLTSADRADLVRYLDTHRESDGTDTDDPFDATNPQHVDERVRGLLYMLAQHPTYMLR